MKGKKFLAGLLSAAMVLSTMAVPVFADETALGTANGNQTGELNTSESYEAKIGDKSYKTLKAAIKAAKSEETVKLVNDVILSKITPFYTNGNDEYYSAITVNKKITLDLNGHSIKWSDEAKNASDSDKKTGNYNIFWLSKGSELTVTGQGVIDGDVGKPERWARIFFIKQGANLIIENGEYYAQQVILFNTNSGASAEIKGGTFGVSSSYTNDGVENLINATGKNVLEKISGGTFIGVDPRCFEDGSTSVAEGCKVARECGDNGKPDKYTVFSSSDAKASVTVPKEKLTGFANSRNIGEYWYKNETEAKKAAESLYGTESKYAEIKCGDIKHYYESSEEANITVTDTASASGVTFTLNDLYKNEQINVSESADYSVVISAVKPEDKDKVDAIKIGASADKSVIAYDIKVVKTVDGKTEEVKVKNQKVTLKLPTALSEEVNKEDITITHIKDNDYIENISVESISGDRKSIMFTVPSFSAIVVTYPKGKVTADNVTSAISVDFKAAVGKSNEYDIVLKAEDGKVINGLTTADLTFALTQGSGVVSYEIEPAANINIINPEKDRYEFNFDGVNEHEATAEAITIGKVIFGGYCEGAKFAVAEAATNIVHTTKTADSIVDEYTVSGENELVVTNKIDDLTIREETKQLTINITFPNAVQDNVKSYQDMSVTIKGGKYSETIQLGKDEAAIAGLDSNVDAVGVNAMKDGAYIIERDLVKDTPYTVEVSGAGYRTARYTVTMNDDKTLNFWNNAKDEAVNVEEGKDSSAKNVTFLAGELVKDGKINVYDLSAVVSYFGTLNNVEAESLYAKYDLNRDGKIDSKDVAYVLVSLGK